MNILLIGYKKDEFKSLISDFKILKNEYQFYYISTIEKYKKILDKKIWWDIIFSREKINKVKFDSFKAYLNDVERDIPFILYVDEYSENIVNKAFRHNINDILLKDRTHRLASLVNREINQNKLRIERHNALKKISSVANFVKQNPNPVIRVDNKGLILSNNKGASPILKNWNIKKNKLLPNKIFDLFKETKFQTFTVQIKHKFYTFNAVQIDTEKYFNLYGFDVTKQKVAEKEIEFRAYYDYLTKLPNRMLFSDRANLAIANATRNSEKLAFLFLDLDGFKNINDTLGHDAGDELLIKVSNRFKKLIRSSDTLSRLGGDEFAILLTNVKHTHSIVNFAERIIKSQKKPLKIKNKNIYISPSIGISIFPLNGKTYKNLLKNADTAMYRAKLKGKARYELFTDEMNAEVSKRLEIENQLNKDVIKKKFSVYFQPINDIKSKQIVRFESLLRWNNKRFEDAKMEDIIRILEELNLLDTMSFWLIECVFNYFAKILDISNLIGSINISANQLLNNNFLKNIESLILKTGINPRCIEFEITESIILKDSLEIQKTLQKLKSLGFGIAIDDFGSGYSSFNYLIKFPINTLKIDQSLIESIDSSDENSKIISIIVDLGKKLKINVIAEGVENKQQFEKLKELGCNYIQGYYYHRPLKIVDFEKLRLQS